MVLDDRYTQTYPTFNCSPHGRDTYYGRHFDYGAVTGQMYTITVPPLGHVGAEANGRFDWPIRTRPSPSACASRENQHARRRGRGLLLFVRGSIRTRGEAN